MFVVGVKEDVVDSEELEEFGEMLLLVLLLLLAQGVEGTDVGGRFSDLMINGLNISVSLSIDIYILLFFIVRLSLENGDFFV